MTTATNTIDIISACKDPNLFLPFFGGDLSTWRPWLIALRVLFGQKVTSKYGRKLIKQCTGRDPNSLPVDGYGFNQAIFLTGRRSGKSRIVATIGAWAAALSGMESKLAVGEQGCIAIISPTKRQGGVVRGYLRGLFDVPILAQEISSDRNFDDFELKNGNRVTILPGDFRHVRGYTVLTAICDELAHFQYAEDSRVRSDTELVRALTPSLATVNGRFIGISSPYARKGYCWNTYQKNFGNDKGSVLVWNAPSRLMNSTLPQSVIDQAMKDDIQSCKCEFFSEFRDDIAIFLPQELIDNLIVKGRFELMPMPGIKYHCFYDASAGRNDAAAICLSHRDGQKVVIDLLRTWPSPHNPHVVLNEAATIAKQWNVTKVVADAFAGSWVSAGWQSHGIMCEKSKLNKSELYMEMIPVISSGNVELLDHKLLIKQLCNLERRTRSGGKDVCDHPPGQHDDASNSCAGAIWLASQKRIIIGAAFRNDKPKTFGVIR